MPINDITGLYESYSYDLGVAIVKQKNGKTLRLNGQNRAIHDIPTSRGVLSVFANLVRTDILLVVLADNSSKGKHGIWQLAGRTMRTTGKKTAFLVAESFSKIIDSPNNEDLILTDEVYNAFLNLVGKAKSKCGASKILFIGEGKSANIALILSAAVDQSYVFAIDPIYNLEIDLSGIGEFRSLPHSRTNLTAFYSRIAPTNYINVMQNLENFESRMQGYLTFKDLFFINSIEGKDFTSRKIFEIYNRNSNSNKINQIIANAFADPVHIIDLFK